MALYDHKTRPQAREPREPGGGFLEPHTHAWIETTDSEWLLKQLKTIFERLGVSSVVVRRARFQIECRVSAQLSFVASVFRSPTDALLSPSFPYVVEVRTRDRYRHMGLRDVFESMRHSLGCLARCRTTAQCGARLAPLGPMLVQDCPLHLGGSNRLDPTESQSENKLDHG